MDVEAYCLTKLGTVEDYPFGEETAVFRTPEVASKPGKIFALTSPPGKPTSINLKCDPTLAVSLRQTYPEITPGYHMNKEHWNTVDLTGKVPADQLKRMIDHSYELIVKSLPKTQREALLGEDQ